jgi:hypothetical protein
MVNRDYWKEDAAFPRFLTVEEAARLLGVLPEWVSLWIGKGKLPVAARSEYAGFLLRTYTVETVGRKLAETAPREVLLSDLDSLTPRDTPPPTSSSRAGRRRKEAAQRKIA